jgi:predicted metalloendopeptidase
MEQNFGGIGAIVGHELTHGFDNLGSRFDAKQDVRDWWSPHVSEEFHKRMQCIADLYSGFQIADSQVLVIGMVIVSVRAILTELPRPGGRL